MSVANIGRRSLRLACVLAGGIGLAGCQTSPKVPQPEHPRVLDAASGIQGDSGVVRTEFRREVDVKDQVGVHLDLARAHEARGDHQAAVYEYARAVEAAENPAGGGGRAAPEQKALAHRRMAAALDRLGQFVQAENHYRIALKLRPDDPRIWNDAGYSAYLQRKWDEAERRLRTAAKLAPDEPRVQTNLGLCLAATGRTDEALMALSKAGGPAVGHANLGYILAALGKTQDARRHYQIAVGLQPQLQAARLALAQLDAPAGGQGAQIATSAGTSDPSVARVTTAPASMATGAPRP